MKPSEDCVFETQEIFEFLVNKKLLDSVYFFLEYKVSIKSLLLLFPITFLNKTLYFSCNRTVGQKLGSKQ